MKKRLLTVFAMMVLLSACGDGVPAVADPHNIVINGEKIHQIDFIKKYCVDKPGNQTCMKVRNAMVLDETKGEVPRF